jgi:lysophospholipase L1-like esterase
MRYLFPSDYVKALLAVIVVLSLTQVAYGAESASIAANSAVYVAPNDASFIYSPYNWLVSSSTAKTINSGAYFRIQVNNTKTCQLRFIIGNATPYCEYWARLDNTSWQEYIPTASGAQIWALAFPADTTSPKRLLEFVVKSTTETQDRWNTQATAIQFAGLELDSGATVSSPAKRKYTVLIYGDSITEGVRVNGYAGIDNDTDRNDSLGDYAYHLGELLDAEVGIVGFGATGLQKGGSGNVPSLPESYNQLWLGQPRSFSTVPDLVIYNEGTNDRDAPIGAQLTLVIQGIGYKGKANTAAGLNGTRQLVLEPFGGYEAQNLQDAVKSINSKNVVYGSTTGFWDNSDASDGLHPYAYAHLNIAPKIAALALPLLNLK